MNKQSAGANLGGSRTEQNLMTAFAAESQARNKYTFFAEKAKQEGFGEISEIFTDSADNERAHAAIWYKLLHGGIGSTEENLAAAAAGEHYEWAEMYAAFAAEAREEGFTDIATLFDSVATIERDHEMRYRAFNENIRAGRVFERETETEWRCANCGHIHRGTAAPATCPVCAHPQAFFAVKSESY